MVKNWGGLQLTPPSRMGQRLVGVGTVNWGVEPPSSNPPGNSHPAYQPTERIALIRDVLSSTAL